MTLNRYKLPAYFLVVPPGHTGTATALNAEMSKLQGKAGRFAYIYLPSRP
jgi:hypothetical protein